MVRTASDGSGGTGRHRHHEREGQTYTIHFDDDHNCTIHHPETEDPDETTTYVYNREAQTVEIEGAEHEIEHLTFESETAGTCHVEDDSGHVEDDHFTLS